MASQTSAPVGLSCQGLLTASAVAVLRLTGNSGVDTGEATQRGPNANIDAVT